MKSSTRKAAGKASLDPLVRPSRNPQKISPTVWYYETRRGIEVYCDDVRRISTARIPWGRILKSLARCRPNNSGQPRLAGKETT